MDRLRERAVFFRNAVRDPAIGALTMTSRYAVASAVARLPAGAHAVIEFGPGSGTMTRALLARLPPHGRLLVIESNAVFVSALAKIRDPRLTVIHGKIQDIKLDSIAGFSRVDAVVSSIPFSLLTSRERNHIISATHRALIPGGSFIIFHQYRRIAVPALKKKFSSVSVSFEPRNILPCFIIEAVK